jgi:hypothetical protein
MPNNLGRDQIWTPDIWAAIDKAMLDEVGAIRVVQKVFHGSATISCLISRAERSPIC